MVHVAFCSHHHLEGGDHFITGGTVARRAEQSVTGEEQKKMLIAIEMGR